MDFDEFCRRLGNLRLDRVTSGGTKPYKPVLLLTVILLIAKRKITERLIFLDGGLRSAYLQLLAKLRPDWQKPPDPRYPFRHLETDGIWRLIPLSGVSLELDAARDTGAKAREILKHVRCAELQEEIFARLSTDHDARAVAISILLERYADCLPPQSGTILWSLMSGGVDNFPAAIRVPEAFTERALEEHLEIYWKTSAFGKMGIALSSVAKYGLAGRQVLTPVNAIDLLGYHEAQKTWWVIELKRGRPSDSVVGQSSRYLGWIQGARPAERAVAAIVAQAADAKLEYAVRANPNLSLWIYDAQLDLQRIV